MEIVTLSLDLSRSLQKHLPEKNGTRHLAMKAPLTGRLGNAARFLVGWIGQLLLKCSA